MPIEIPSDLQPFVAQQLRLGLYQSEQQLVDDAVRLLKAERDEAVDGICLGLSDAAAGRIQPLADAFQDLRQEFQLRETS